MIEDSSKASSHLGALVKAHIPTFGFVGAIMGFISDVLTPFAPIANYAAVIFLVLSAALFTLYLALKSRRALTGAVVSVSIGLCNLGIVTLQYITGSEPNGVLSNSFSTIESLQQKLGLISDDIKVISESVEKIEGNTGELVGQSKEANQKLAKISESMDVLVKNRIEIESSGTAELRQISAQLSSLTKLGGLVANPTNFSEYYHNARIFSQRGEVDLALAAYEQVFRSSIMFADPVIDVTTLLTRLYGTDGAQVYLEKKLRNVLQPSLYVYAKQLLSEQPIDEAWQSIAEDPIKFPPLTVLLIQRGKENRNRDNLTWSETVQLVNAAKALDQVVKSGEFLAYFIDQVRGEVVNEKISNWISDADEQNKYGPMDLSESPVALYFTLSAEIPNEVLGKKGTVGFSFRSFHDRMDMNQPFTVCAETGSGEKCIDIREFSCAKVVAATPKPAVLEETTLAPEKPAPSAMERLKKTLSEPEIRVVTKGCVPFSKIGGFLGPQSSGSSTIDAIAIFGVPCLSKIVYQDIKGKIVQSVAKQMPASYEERERYGGDKLLKQIEKCGYKLWTSR